MGFVTLGCFLVFFLTPDHSNIAARALGLEGAIMVMISHGFISGALFIGVGFIYDRLHTRQIQDIQGIANSMPIFASFFMLFSLANVGLPGTSGFVGEFMIILGALKSHFWIAIAAASTLIFGAAYTLWMYKRVIFGAVGSDSIGALRDIRGIELVSFSILALMVLLIGVYPAWLLDLMHQSVSNVLELASLSKVTIG